MKMDNEFLNFWGNEIKTENESKNWAINYLSGQARQECQQMVFKDLSEIHDK